MVDIAAGMAPETSERGFLALFLVNVWAARHIWARHRGEDHRYGAMRKKFGRHWWWSFFQVFLLQIILIWFLLAPLVVALHGTAPLGLLDHAGLALAAAGLIFEVVADAQLGRFRRDPANKGRVMDRGLWGWSRHPNYFGEAMMWWGFLLIGLSAGGAWWIVLSPILMTLLLLKISGVALMEDGMEERRPAYAAYKKRVGAFVPMPGKAR